MPFARRAAAIAAAASLAVGLIGPGSGAAVAAPAAGLAWTPCADPDLFEFECATLPVPLDRHDPAAGSITLALTRHRATGTADQRIGSLVFNPGGPGVSGLGSAATTWDVLTEDIKARFDLVTWDPRGVGRSTPALRGCAQPALTRPITGPVDWPAIVADYEPVLAKANAACVARNRRIAGHLGTNESVADLDRIRAALGEEKLTYWGMSYGTRIGYVYALKHPQRVRAMVLDGSIDPAGSFLGTTEAASAPDQAFGSVSQAFPLTGDRLNAVLARLNRRPLTLPDGQVLDRWLMRDTIGLVTPKQDAYSLIAGFVDLAYRALFGSGSDRFQARTTLAVVVGDLRSGAGNGGNAGGPFSLVNCLDYADRPTREQVDAAVRQQRRLGPLFGGTMATLFGLGCAGLTVEPDPIPRITGVGSQVPVLIVGASRDGATSVQWTARMSRAFPASRTVTYAGGQHVVWSFAGSWCVDFVADAYVMDLELPRADIGCPNIYLPDV